MGKTIQAISLILDNRPLKVVTSKSKSASNDFKLYQEQDDLWSAMEAVFYSENSNSISSLKLLRAGTLIVLPTVAIRQWQSEIARFTAPGSLSVFVSYFNVLF